MATTEEGVKAGGVGVPEDGLLDALLRPRSIAVVGASADPGKPGGRLIRSLRRFRPSTPVVGVSPRPPDDQDLGPWASSLDAVENLDQVLVAVPADAAIEIVGQAGKRGARTAIVYASGFGEAPSTGGADRLAALSTVIGETGIRVLGPNCLGYISVQPSGDFVMGAWFGTLDQEDYTSVPVSAAPIALLSHSGGVGSMVIGHLRAQRLWPREYVSTGNEADLSLLELLRCYERDAEVQALGLYLEGGYNGIELAETIGRLTEQGTTVACLVGGRTEAGQRSVVSHSGRLARDGGAYARRLERSGALIADGPWDLAMLLGTAIRRGRSTSPPRSAAVVAASGGMATLTADLAGEAGLTLAELPETVHSIVRRHIPGFANAGNPLDIGGPTMQKHANMRAIVSAVAGGAGADLMIVTAGAMRPGAMSIVGGLLAGLHDGGREQRCLVYWPHSTPEAMDALWEAGVPCLATEQDLRGVISAECRVGVPRRRTSDSEGGEDYDPGVHLAVTAFANAVASGDIHTEAGAKRIARVLGFQTPRSEIVTSTNELLSACRRVGYPVVLKGQIPGLAHKSEVGLVALNVMSEASARTRYDQMVRLAGERAGFAVQVERQELVRHELLLGYTRTDYGTVITFGSGGTGVESVGDTASEYVPLTDDGARELMRRTVAGRTLAAQQPLVADRIRQQLIRLSEFSSMTVDLNFDLDLNPVGVTSYGAVIALDAAFTRTETSERSWTGPVETARDATALSIGQEGP